MTDGSKPVNPPAKPSPYVRIYIARTQAEAVLRTLRLVAHGRAASSPLRRAIAVIEKALG